MSTQLLATNVEILAWSRLLRAHAGVIRQLNADLVAAHGLTVNDYEVLLHLARAPERALRRVDLAQRVLLTPSGITRLLDGLERCGLVERAGCPSDGRVVYAKLTDAGYARLQKAAETHRGGLRELFSERFSSKELKTLSGLLGRLPACGDDDDDCSVNAPESRR